MTEIVVCIPGECDSPDCKVTRERAMKLFLLGERREPLPKDQCIHPEGPQITESPSRTM